VKGVPERISHGKGEEDVAEVVVDAKEESGLRGLTRR
jgi:biotin synthase-related radical SAM superfamily protein